MDNIIKILMKAHHIIIRMTDITTKRFYTINPKKVIKVWYFIRTGRKLNLNDPKTFDEKIQWLKLYWQNPLIVQCADKYGVREYCNLKDSSEILNEVYGIYSDASEIKWEDIPQKFVMKTTNSTGTNLICLDKEKINQLEVERKLNKWLSKDSNKISTERHYAQMTPKIIAEKFIESKGNGIPIDYKFFCFNGEPLFVSVVKGRTEADLKKNIYKTYFNLDWENIILEKNATNTVNNNEIIEKPRTYDLMIKYARRLSKDFPFVRVDFYEGDEYPILGEMTFTPSSGIGNYYTKDVQYQLGDKLKLPNEIIISNW